MMLTTMWKLADALYFCTSLHSTDLDSHGEECRPDNCSQHSEKLLLLLCTARFLYTTCYMLCCQLWFFSVQKRKINCKEGWEFVFILAWWRWVPGWRRTAVGEGWPTHYLLPLPCLAAQSLWQNKPPGILGKHWALFIGMHAISWQHHGQKKLHTPYCLFFFFINWIVTPAIKDMP